MEISFGTRLKHAWNAFRNRDPTPSGYSYPYRPDRPLLTRGNNRSIVTSIFNRIAIDVASIDIKHCRLDENNRFVETIDSGLNRCLNLEANIDQTGQAFIQDVVMSMFDEGVVAMVPVETDLDPKITKSYDIFSMRTGKIVEWYPAHVKRALLFRAEPEGRDDGEKPAGGAAQGARRPSGGCGAGAGRVAADRDLAGEGEVQPVPGAGAAAGPVFRNAGRGHFRRFGRTVRGERNHEMQAD